MRMKSMSDFLYYWNKARIKLIDPRVSVILEQEFNRQETTVELIASENFASQAVMDLAGSCFTNKYAERTLCV